jgi:mannose-6-phosphate isomerase-like protein (cupin superfamily)
MTIRRSTCALALVSTLALPVGSQGQEPAAMTTRNTAEMEFATFPGMPTCATGSVQKGDPAQGATFIAAKAQTGCVFPWHWHTPNEHLMIVSGTAQLEMKGGKTVVLEAGGFAVMPSKHLHQFTCKKTCTLFVYSDAAFDMHYVDAQGNEISPEVALKAVGEVPGAPPTK